MKIQQGNSQFAPRSKAKTLVTVFSIVLAITLLALVFVNNASPVAASENIIFSMTEDPYILGLTVGETTSLAGTSFISPSAGTVEITTVSNPTNANLRSLQITNRNADWHGLDLSRVAMNLDPTRRYNITVTGRGLEPIPEPVGWFATAPTIALRGSSAPWDNLAVSNGVTPESPAFSISWNFIPAQLGERNLRIQTPGNNENWSFVVDSIIIRDLGEAPPANVPLRDYFPNIHDENFATLFTIEPFLTDPFAFFAPIGQTSTLGTDGRVVTEADWQERRAEITDLIMYYYFGYKWQTPIEAITINTTERPTDGGMINITINDTLTNGDLTTTTGDIATNVWLPTFAQLEANGFAETGGPIIIYMIGGMQPELLEEALDRGYGVLSLANVAPWNETRTGMYFELYPFEPAFTQYNTGTLMATAWQVSRVLDVFELMPEWGVNPNMAVTIGVSFAGKRALISGIMDERVALIVPVESGGDGGLASFRHSTAGRIPFNPLTSTSRVFSRHETPRSGNAGRGASITATFFRQNLPHEESLYLLPFDMHLVLALAAPRAVLSFENNAFGTWMGPYSTQVTISAAREVWDFLGYETLATIVRGGDHAIQPRDIPVVFAVMDSLFSRTDGRVYLSGTLYDSISAISQSPYIINHYYIQWANPNSYTLWTRTELVTEGFATIVRAYSNAPSVELITPNATFISPVLNGVAIFELSTEDVVVGIYELQTVGTELLNRSIAFQGIDLQTTLRAGSTRDNTNYNTIYGFTSRINPETLRVYIINAEGEVIPITASTAENIASAWILPYGVALRHPNPNGVLILRGLQFESMPSVTFVASFDDSLHPQIPSAGATVEWDRTRQLRISREPMNPNNFIIGTNFLADFDVAWGYYNKWSDILRDVYTAFHIISSCDRIELPAGTPHYMYIFQLATANGEILPDVISERVGYSSNTR